MLECKDLKKKKHHKKQPKVERLTPDQVANIVRDTLRLSPDSSDVISTAVSYSNNVNAREIVTIAIQSGMSKESATAAAIAGGAKLIDIVRITQ